MQWLADAHQHHMRHPFARIFLGGINLGCNLSGRKVTHTAGLRGRTEAAAHRTAHLGGDADRIAVMIPHEYRLDAVAVRKLKQIFDRSVL